MIFCFVVGTDLGSIFKVDGQTKITIAELKDMIYEKKKNSFEDKNFDSCDLNLWLVDIPYDTENVQLRTLQNRSRDMNEENIIIQELGGKNLFPVDDIGDIFTYDSKNIRIIVQPPPPAITASLSFKEIIEVIKKDALKGTFNLPDVLSMPLQQRNFEVAMSSVNKTIYNNIAGRDGKSNYWCIVSGGAPGIGKTRFGQELFNQVRNDMPQHIQNIYNDCKIPHDRRKTDIHLEYLCIDFGNGHMLTSQDYGMDASIILGLRIAHAFFIEKDYGITFQEFRITLKQYRGSFDNFQFHIVIGEIRKFLNLSDKHLFFLYLHIDEFQLIDSWDKKDKSNPPTKLFYYMIYNISEYMLKSALPTFIQPFLSGTALLAVIRQKKASRISFQFVDCPLLNDKSIIRITDHFAEKFNAGIANYAYKWKYCRQMLQLLRDTANGKQGREFFEKLERNEVDFVDYFIKVKDTLDKQYGIKYYVKNNRNVATKLMYFCIEGIPIDPNECLDDNNLALTIRSLESDKHIIISSVKVEQSDELFFINMPFYFICLYNDVLHIVDPTLVNKFYDERMYWNEWKKFVAYYEAFHTNLAIRLGKKTMMLRELYPNADKSDVYFDMSVKLKPLRVCEANEQFPLTNPLTEKSDGEIIDWQSGDVVVINGSCDVFFVRELVDTFYKKFIMMSQCKWDYGSKKVPESKVEEEYEKNLQNFYAAAVDNENYIPITIIFTSQPYSDSKEKQESGILVISKEDFKKHFGPVFSSRASFAIAGNTNPNFWEKNRLKNVLDGIGDVSIGNVIKKRPYYSDNDYRDKNPGAKKIPKMDYFPFDVSERLLIENR
ncbi:hypothetical protein RhiirA4_523646 [Rhizophagus irregularis]|uniref:Crinkler effector protein N-terminal domain-containing protein n=1 Tax=Rhizophagus irregularis TaxID=588596 RepID=A0A2I1GMN2_9GLOM|nr:hypothetical protein RhiirA4_523646 [Rhizophagus irregularis]